MSSRGVERCGWTYPLDEGREDVLQVPQQLHLDRRLALLRYEDIEEAGVLRCNGGGKQRDACGLRMGEGGVGKRRRMEASSPARRRGWC